MKIHYILFLISIVILIITVYVLSQTNYNTNPRKKEGFESLTNCLSQGYPTEFCNRVPLQACLYNCPKGTFEPKKFNTFSSQFPT